MRCRVHGFGDANKFRGACGEDQDRHHLVCHDSVHCRGGFRISVCCRSSHRQRCVPHWSTLCHAYPTDHDGTIGAAHRRSHCPRRQHPRVHFCLQEKHCRLSEGAHHRRRGGGRQGVSHGCIGGRCDVQRASHEHQRELDDRITTWSPSYFSPDVSPQQSWFSFRASCDRSCRQRSIPHYRSYRVTCS